MLKLSILIGILLATHIMAHKPELVSSEKVAPVEMMNPQRLDLVKEACIY